MPRRVRNWVLLFVALLLSPAFADAPKWQLYTHPDKLFSVKFPGKPAEQTQEGSTGTDKIRVKVATFIDGNRMFMASANVYSDAERFEGKARDAVLDHALDPVLRAFKGRIAAQKPIKVDGVEGREIQITGPGLRNKPFRSAARVLIDPPRTVYVVWTMQLDGDEDPDAQPFLASLHVGKDVETAK